MKKPSIIQAIVITAIMLITSLAISPTTQAETIKKPSVRLGPVFFAFNLDTPDGMKDLYKRQAIVPDILQSIEALPSKN
nr:hypothetical protein [Colwellia piezophila]